MQRGLRGRDHIHVSMGSGGGEQSCGIVALENLRKQAAFVPCTDVARAASAGLGNPWRLGAGA